MEKTIRVFNLGNLPVCDFEEFYDLQEDFKIYDPELNKKLQNLIISRGFKYSFLVWIDETGKKWIIDAHQRKKALAELRSQGYDIPAIPYESIYAEDKRDAVAEIAAQNSIFAQKNPDTILFDKYEISDDDLSIFNLDMSPINMDFSNMLSDEPELKAEQDDYEEPEDLQTDIELGDIIEFSLGNLKHRLLCGDSTSSEDVNKLLAGAKPMLMVTDPPYGVNYDPSWRAKVGGKIKSVSKVTNDDNPSWFNAYVLFPGNVVYIWHGALFTHVFATDIEEAGFSLVSQIIWNKNTCAMSRGDIHWKHESCWYGVKKGQRHNWQGARNVMSVWDIQNLSSKSVREREGVSGHGTQKPIECMARPIMNNSAINDSVYDPFIGSGTTMVASHQLHRNCYAMEITPKHCQMVIDRMKRFDLNIIVTINGQEYNGNI